MLGLLAPDLSAQQRYRVVRADAFRQEAGPQGKQLATIEAGVEVLGGSASPQNGWVEVVLDGWVWGASVGRINRDGHNLSVTASRGENLRITPNGGVVARLLPGFLLDELGREGAWVHARRDGWMDAQSLVPVTPAAATGVASESPARTPAPAPDQGDALPALDRAVVARMTPLAHAPDGDAAGTLAPEVPIRILARSGDWVRVQAEGWVREVDLRPSAPGIVAGLTAAELRTRPQAYEGKLVQWTLQFLSIATADELRPEIPKGRRYLLTRGPLPEAGFVYVMVSGSQLREAQSLPPLAQVVVVARIKNGRSKYLGNPVLELVEIQVKQP
ncbi:MAG: hypothetical protein HY560_00070 [Gemmatimonadetes bacterium]|nr:hypothetical protein [Gemmatimonadota bacterium]